MPGFFAQAIFALTALLLLLAAIGAPLLLLVMAAQSRVLGRPTLPPRAPPPSQ